jgi:hypothetical protein
MKKKNAKTSKAKEQRIKAQLHKKCGGFPTSADSICGMSHVIL